MCSELCKDFYVVYQLEMVAGEVESSCELVVTFFFFFFFLVSPYQTIERSLGQLSEAPPHINYFLRRWLYDTYRLFFHCQPLLVRGRPITPPLRTHPPTHPLCDIRAIQLSI